MDTWGGSWGASWGDTWGAIDSAAPVGGGGSSISIRPEFREEQRAAMIRANNDAIMALIQAFLTVSNE